MKPHRDLVLLIIAIVIIGSIYVIINIKDITEEKTDVYDNWEYWTYANGKLYRAYDLKDKNADISFMLEVVDPMEESGTKIIHFEHNQLWIPIPVRDDFPVFVDPSEVKYGSHKIVIEDFPDIKWDEEYYAEYHFNGSD